MPFNLQLQQVQPLKAIVKQTHQMVQQSTTNMLNHAENLQNHIVFVEGSVKQKCAS